MRKRAKRFKIILGCRLPGKVLASLDFPVPAMTNLD